MVRKKLDKTLERQKIIFDFSVTILLGGPVRIDFAQWDGFLHASSVSKTEDKFLSKAHFAPMSEVI